MNAHSQTDAFTKPDWATGEELDLTGELFLDLEPLCDGEITAFFRIVDRLGNEVGYGNPGPDHRCIVDGIRITHPDGLIEWRDRAWLMGFDAADIIGADGMAERDAGILDGRFAA